MSVATEPRIEIHTDIGQAWFYHRCTDWSFENFGIAEARLPLGEGGWQLINEHTISPSVHCHNCGTHGFWTDGKWITA